MVTILSVKSSCERTASQVYNHASRHKEADNELREVQPAISLSMTQLAS